MEAAKAKKIGLILIFVVIGVVIVWDSLMQGLFGLSHTISQSVWEATSDNPIITVAICAPLFIIVGHLFWPGFSADARRQIANLKAENERLTAENVNLRFLISELTRKSD